MATMREQIAAVCAKAQTGEGRIRITFNATASSADVYYLLGMVQGNILRFCNPSDEIVMLAVAQSERWEHEDNRTVTLELTKTFDLSWFQGRLARRLSNIKAV